MTNILSVEIVQVGGDDLVKHLIRRSDLDIDHHLHY